MTPESIATVALIATLILDRVLGALKSRGIDLQTMSRQIDDLHDWHNKADDEGVKLWYVRRSLETAIVKLSENIELETKLLDRIDRRLEHIESSQNTLHQLVTDDLLRPRSP